MTSPPPRQPEQKSEKTSSRAHPFAISNVVDAPYEQNSPQRSAEAGISSVSASSAHSTIASLEMNPRTVSYKLRILQHPNRVRCCGFGNKDRRAIDPPPVVELVRVGADGNAINSCEEAPFLVCHASLWSADGLEDRSLVENIYATSGSNPADTSVHAVVGSQVAISQPLVDVDGKRKMMFLFPDLSVRLPGQYTLRFQLVDVSMGHQSPGSIGYVGRSPIDQRETVEGKPVLAMVQSETFDSYRPKQFPGMLKSTELSRKLAEQGIVEIRTRKSPPPHRPEGS